MNKQRPIFRICFLLLVSFLFLLSGCSTVSHKDGPPNFRVDASKIPDAVPKDEPLSKYGNYRRYVVWGKVYHTLPTAKNYEEQGTASWYGTAFHSRHTSSGERYDMLSMTAAHKTLPLPTYVQVTNLRNGKQVIVKVNDRGPFSGDRLIDVSYAAALKLGMVGHGTAHVDVKAIDPVLYAQQNEKFLPIHLASAGRSSNHRHHSRHLGAPVEDIQTASSAHTGSSHYIQVGAFRNLAYAKKLQSKLEQMTASPVKIAMLLHAHKHLYHVRIGPIKDMAAATRLTQQLKHIGLSSTMA